MSVTNVVRNLRDGQLTIKDATSGTPQSLTVFLDEGNLNWSQTTRTIVVTDRGLLSTGHTRKGNEQPLKISFSAKWTQLIGKSNNPSDALQLYEFLMFLTGANIVSTSSAGEQETLLFEFTITDPSGTASEKITFGKVFRDTLTMSERNTANLISFVGRDFASSPVIQRV